MPGRLGALLLVGLAAGCAPAPDGELERRVAALELREPPAPAVTQPTTGTAPEVEARLRELERRLEETRLVGDARTLQAQAHQVAVTVALLEQVDVQGLVRRLGTGGQLRPIDTTTVVGAARAFKRADWPPYLRVEADDLIERLDALTEALRGEDVERARRLAPEVLAFQLEMSRAADRWLQANAPWTRQTAPGHSHGGD